MRFQGRAVGVAIGMVLAIGTPSFAEEPPQHLEVLLEIHKNGKISLVKQTVRQGRLPGPKHPEFREGFWAIQAEDAAGQELYTTTTPDPRILHVDVFAGDSTEPGRLTGQTVVLDEAVFPVRLPKDARLKGLKISRLKRTIEHPPRDAHQGPQRPEHPASLPEDALEHLDDVVLEDP